MARSHLSCGRKFLVRGLAVCAFIASPALIADTVVFKITDRFGNVTYTDELPKEPDPNLFIQTITLVNPDFGNERPAVEPAIAYPPIQKADDKVRGYEKIAIVSPGDDETLRANNGDIVLRADVVPSLQPGHALRFYIGGEAVGTVAGNQLALANVDRGTHSLRVDVVNEDSEVVQSSSSSIFHVQRTSALAPVRKTKPSPPALKQ